jgi:hypothetical protein
MLFDDLLAWFIPYKLGMVVLTYNPISRRLRQEEYKLEVSLGYQKPIKQTNKQKIQEILLWYMAFLCFPVPAYKCQGSP